MMLDNYLKNLLNGSEVANVNIVDDNATTSDVSKRSSSGIETAGKIGRAQSLYSMAPNGTATTGGSRNGVDHQTSRWESRRLNSDSTLGKPKRRGSAEIQSIDIWKCMQNERAMDTCLSLPSRGGRRSPIEGCNSVAVERRDRSFCDIAADQMQPPTRLESDDHHKSADGPIGQPRRRRSSSTLLASLGPMAPTRTNSGDISAFDKDPTPRQRSTSISSETSDNPPEDGSISCEPKNDRDGSAASKSKQVDKIQFPKRPQKKRLVRSPTPGHHKNCKLGDNTSTVRTSTGDDGISGIVTEDEDSAADSSPQNSSDDSPDPTVSAPSSPTLSREGGQADVSGKNYNKLMQLHHTTSSGSAGGPTGTEGIIPVGGNGTASSQGFPRSLRELPYESGQSSPTPSDEDVVATATRAIENEEMYR